MNSKHLIYSISAAFLALCLMYIDTKLLDNPKTRVTYIKGMSMVAIVTWILLYFLDGGFSQSSSTQYLPGIHEEMLTGPPTF